MNINITVSRYKLLWPHRVLKQNKLELPQLPPLTQPQQQQQYPYTTPPRHTQPISHGLGTITRVARRVIFTPSIITIRPARMMPGYTATMSWFFATISPKSPVITGTQTAFQPRIVQILTAMLTFEPENNTHATVAHIFRIFVNK